MVRMMQKKNENVIANAKTSAFWEKVLRMLTTPNRKKKPVNLGRIDKIAKDNDTIVVPSKVLSAGSLHKKITIAAESFSASAKAAIEKAGSKIIPIETLAKSDKKGTKLVILK
jgi:large subunit ribosomal protein L18e